MKWIPHHYQEEAVGFLLKSPKAGLLLDMGLGKTSITLYALKQLMDAGHVKRVLLSAPIRALQTVWPEEIKKWDDFKSIPYHNWHESRVPAKDLPKTGIIGINPESLLPLLKVDSTFDHPFEMLIIDESAGYKNYSSQRFKYLKKRLHLFKYRWILTGTPAPNGLEDLWSQIYILDRGEALGEYITHFRNTYCMPDHSGYGYTVMKNLKEVMYQRISHLVLRMAATDHLDMPELVYNPVPVKLGKKAYDEYKQMERHFVLLLEQGDLVTSPNAAVAGMRCRQLANGGIYLPDGSIAHTHMHKMDALKEIVENLQGQPLLVFYEFVHDQERITQALGDVPNLTKSKDPLKLVKEFNEGKHPVVIGHPSTIGVGLNLQGACSNVLWTGVPWDLMLHDQANARVYRQGQAANRVMIHYLMAEGTLDSAVFAALASKRREQQDLFDAIQRIRLDSTA